MLQRIKQGLPQLSRAERRVASWVLAHPRQTTQASVADIARFASTSQPTVIRFCRSVGSGGFREFKLRLVESLSQPASYVHRDVSSEDSIGDAVTKVLDSSILALQEMRSLLGSLPCDEAVSRMAEGRQLIFSGLGASAEVARDARQKFFRLGIPCMAATDSPTILQTAAIATPEDVFVFVSHTGRWPAITEAASIARGRGATVIALAGPESGLAAIATVCFGMLVPEDTSIYTPMSSRLAHLALLDALQVALAIRLGAVAEANLRASKRVLAIG